MVSDRRASLDQETEVEPAMRIPVEVELPNIRCDRRRLGPLSRMADPTLRD